MLAFFPQTPSLPERPVSLALSIFGAVALFSVRTYVSILACPGSPVECSTVILVSTIQRRASWTIDFPVSAAVTILVAAYRSVARGVC